MVWSFCISWKLEGKSRKVVVSSPLFCWIKKAVIYYISNFIFTLADMKKDEVTICSKDNVYLNVIKQKTVHSWWYWWARVRLWKWFSVNTWKIAWDSIKEKYVDQIWPWTLMITNQRMIFMSMEKNITVKLQDLVQANTFYDGIKLADDKWTYHFTFEDDWWEFCNKFIKFVQPDSPWLPPKEVKTETANDSILLKRWFRLILFVWLTIILSVIS